MSTEEHDSSNDSHESADCVKIMVDRVLRNTCYNADKEGQMKITVLVDDFGDGIYTTVHGLSLYVETEFHKVLFDVGPDETVFINAEKLGIDLRAVDTIVISHGHNDHNGALKSLLEFNDRAKVFIQRQAFGNYISYSKGYAQYIGADLSLSVNPRVVQIDGDYRIDDELSIITAFENYAESKFNEGLFCGEKKDNFNHEQHLLIKSNDKTVVIAGCAHCGVNAVMKKCGFNFVDYFIGGFHMPDKFYSERLFDNFLQEISQYNDTRFVTCHCTGERSFFYLKRRLHNLCRIKCGDSLKV